MITYMYWMFVVGLSVACLYMLVKYKHPKVGAAMFLSILSVGFLAYYFHFEQVFVKRYGGVMAISVPEGQHHIAATWKEDNLWIENYDPKTNTCHFNEYSKGNLLQGKVTIKNCSPLVRAVSASPKP